MEPDGRAGTERFPWLWQVLLLAAIAAWLAMVHLAGAGLIEPDEPRTALVARLMVERGDWLVPHLPAVFHHDYPHDPVEGYLVAYWDKPPLYFWLAAAAMKALGPTALAARLPAALAFVATVLLVYAAGRSLGGARTGLWAGLVMATSPLVLVMAHVARMDALLVALMAAMLVAVLRLMDGTARPRPRRAGPWAWTAVLWAAAGLGLLAKGPEAVVLPAIAVLAAVALTGRWRDLARLRPLAGAAVCLAVAAPWYIYMHMCYPASADGSSAGFLYEFLVRQHFGRAASGEFGHALPPGTLLGILLGGFMPWTIFLPGACARLWRGGWRALQASPATVLLVAWPVVVLAAFSLTRTQLPHYVMPAFPPLAILTGAYLDERLRVAAGNSGGARADGGERRFRAGLAMTVALGVLFVVGAAIVLPRLGLWRAGHAWWIAGITVLMVAGSAAVWRRRHAAALALGVAGIAAITTFIFSADPFRIYPVYSPRYQIHEMKEEMRPGDAILAYPHQSYGFAWYLWGEPVLYPTPGGGPTEEPSEDVLVAELNRPRRTFCMLQRRAIVDEIRPRVRWPIRLVSEEESRYTLIVTEPPADVLPPHLEGHVRDR